MKSLDSKIFLGKLVEVIVDRPLGSRHPRHNFIYEINYGYIPGTLADDGKELDAYILGVTTPVQKYSGICIAFIERLNDSDDKLIVVPDGFVIDDAGIRAATVFQEQYFKSRIVRRESPY